MQFVLSAVLVLALFPATWGQTGTTDCLGTGITASICLTRNCFCQPPCYARPCPAGGTGSSGSTSSTDTTTRGPPESQPGNDAGTTTSPSRNGKSGGHCFNIALATLATAELEGASCSHSGNRDMWCCGRYCYTPEHLTTGSCPVHLRSLRRDVEAFACSWQKSADKGLEIDGLVVYQQVGPLAKVVRILNRLAPRTVSWFASRKLP
jgi:hypothetical protein